MNAIAPVVVDGEHGGGVYANSQLRKDCFPIEKARLWAVVLIDRMATAACLAEMAVFLASGDADYIVEQTCKVDDGNWMS